MMLRDEIATLIYNNVATAEDSDDLRIAADAILARVRAVMKDDVAFTAAMRAFGRASPHARVWDQMVDDALDAITGETA